MTDAIEDSTPSPSDERSPLLGTGDRNNAYNGSIEGAEQAVENSSLADGGDEPQVTIAEEPSNKKLFLVLGSIWVGCFLAALGSSPALT